MSLSGSWDLQIEDDVYKSLKKLPRHEAEKILVVIKLFPSDPYIGDIQKMEGEEDTWRRRIGAYRIFYKIMVSEKIILIFRVERRTSKTY